MIDKLIRAIRLDTTLYNQVEVDQTESTNALIVVILVSVLGGIGAALAALTLSANPNAAAFAPNPISAFVGAIINGVLGWIIWSYVVYFVGTRVYHATATPGELLRTLGYAQAPKLLGILGVIPILGGIIVLLASLWTIVTTFIAAREALDLDNTKTLITVILGVVAVVVLSIIVGTVLGIGALGVGALTGAFGR